MSSEMPSEVPASQFVDGLQLNSLFSTDVFRSAPQYKARDDDVFIATYPKCGTTWTRHIVLLIFRQGDPPKSPKDFFTAVPNFEKTGAKAVETMPKPVAVTTHLPFHLIPWSDKAKYIYVTRNPKDCCVSKYHHVKRIAGCRFNGTFDQFFELFLSGKVDYGDYFDHLMGWYEHRNDLNVRFMTYEEMKENPEASILRLASFIDEEKYAKPLREDPEKLQNVLKYSSFEHMKEALDKRMDELFCMSEEEVLKSDTSEHMKRKLTARSKLPKGVTVMRKGITGDWKNYFNGDQSKRLDQKFAERTKGTDLLNLWKNYM